jgi:hypothetical protein
MRRQVSPEHDVIDPITRQLLMRDPDRVVQSFEYYAAHFLIGSKLTGGDLPGNITALAHEFKLHHDTGLEIGLRHPAHVRRPG